LLFLTATGGNIRVTLLVGLYYYSSCTFTEYRLLNRTPLGDILYYIVNAIDYATQYKKSYFYRK